MKRPHPLHRGLVLLPSLLMLGAAAGAQLRSPGESVALRVGLDEELPLLVLPQPDLERYRAEDAAQTGVVPWRYGAVIPAELDLDRHGRWDEVEGSLVWRAEIASPGAYSLGILFAEFDLPPGGQLFVYGRELAPGRRHVLGAFTEATEQPNGMLAIQPLAGDRAILEYVQPLEAEGSPHLVVESVVHDYRDVIDRVGVGPLEAASCLIDVNCPQGAAYQQIKQAVVALFRGGFVCSGTILNNTAEDATPYMLTAQHCGSFTNGTFVFNYERPGCGTGTAPLNDSLSGATLLASDNYVDGQLYRLNQAPPASYRPVYAGWGRSPTPPPPGVGISHPAGLPRKISIDDQAPMDGGKNWLVNWDQGEIQGGSSGSSLLNGQGRVIGSLTAGSGTCNGQTVSYGQFRQFWQRRSLGQWLDPLNTGAAFIDAFDPFAATATSYNGSGANPATYTSLTVPALGTTWQAEVDASGVAGATTTLLLGHAQPAAGQFFGFGELLLDLGSQRYFRRTSAVSGGTSSFSSAIPPDPFFQGAKAWSQAFVIGSAVQATNGVELRVY